MTRTRRTIYTLAMVAAAAAAQVNRADWRRIGNSSIDLGLASVATGPVERVWYSEDGATLYARTILGRVYATADFESWTAMGAEFKVPEIREAAAPRPPEARVHIRLATRGRFYAAGEYVYRSDDNGLNWTNLTAYRGNSILGGPAFDLAVSPRDSEDLTAAGSTGIWRSTDGGLTWNGLNAGLPNLTFDRILATPVGVSGSWNGHPGSGWRGVSRPKRMRPQAPRGNETRGWRSS
jgi:hypothetical protein